MRPNATILFGTDTFLAGYARAAHPYDFRSLRYVLAGAEPVKEATRPALHGEVRPPHPRRLWRHRDGARRSPSTRRCFNKAGTRRPHPARHGGPARAGRRHRRRRPPVRPRPERHARLSPRRTSRRARAAARTAGTTPATSSRSTREGFVTIKGRAKRFAKIGGEMVSLAAVEALAAELWPDALPPPRPSPTSGRARRIVLVDERCRSATRAAFHAHARARGATELMVPAEMLCRRRDCRCSARQGRQRRGRGAGRGPLRLGAEPSHGAGAGARLRRLGQPNRAQHLHRIR